MKLLNNSGQELTLCSRICWILPSWHLHWSIIQFCLTFIGYINYWVPASQWAGRTRTNLKQEMNSALWMVRCNCFVLQNSAGFLPCLWLFSQGWLPPFPDVSAIVGKGEMKERLSSTIAVQYFYLQGRRLCKEEDFVILNSLLHVLCCKIQ